MREVSGEGVSCICCQWLLMCVSVAGLWMYSTLPGGAGVDTNTATQPVVTTHPAPRSSTTDSDHTRPQCPHTSPTSPQHTRPHAGTVQRPDASRDRFRRRRPAAERL